MSHLGGGVIHPSGHPVGVGEGGEGRAVLVLVGETPGVGVGGVGESFVGGKEDGVTVGKGV